MTAALARAAAFAGLLALGVGGAIAAAAGFAACFVIRALALHTAGRCRCTAQRSGGRWRRWRGWGGGEGLFSYCLSFAMGPPI